MKHVIVLLMAAVLILMIINSTALSSSVYSGVVLCLRVVIPSLFPFFIITAYMNGIIMQHNVKLLRPIGKFCRIPQGAESMLLIGLLGGYPVGAQCVVQAYESNALSRSDAERMLGFCNNAGPAFIFGMVSVQFSRKYILWLLWLVQIMSCILTAHILPGGDLSAPCFRISAKHITFKRSVEKSTSAITAVCSWVVIFKVIVSVVFHIFRFVPPWCTVLLSGLIELVNGCNTLSALETTGLRFVLASAMLSFGGICVHMQTAAVTEPLRKDLYIKGKLLQTGISTVLSFLVQLCVM